ISLGDRHTGRRCISSSLNGSGAGPGSPAQPTHAASRPRMTDYKAVTRPPGLRRQVLSPLASTTRSTGRRFAATTRSNVGAASVTLHQLLNPGSEVTLGDPVQFRSSVSPALARVPGGTT